MRTTFYKFFLILTTLFTFSINATWAKYVYIDVTELQDKGAPDRQDYSYVDGNYYIDNLRVHFSGNGIKDSVKIESSQFITVNNRKLCKVDIGNATNWQISTIRESDGRSIFYHPTNSIPYGTEDSYKNKYIIKRVAYAENDTATGKIDHIIGLVTGGLVYFNNHTTQWKSPIEMLIGHGSFARTYPLKQIPNTTLWYTDLTKARANWPDATYYAFINTDKDNVLNQTPEQAVRGGDGYGGNYSNTEIYRTQTELNDAGKYMCTPENNEDGTDITFATANISTFNIIQTVKIRTTTTSSYSILDNNWPATFSLTTTTISNDTVSMQSTSTGTSKLQQLSVFTGRTRFSYESLDTDRYHFEGWGTGTPSATNYYYENNYLNATTMYAFFTKKYQLNFSTTIGGTMTATTEADDNLSTGVYVIGGTSITYKATPAPGYSFSKWVDGSDTELSTDATYTASIEDDITIKAVFVPQKYTITFDQQGATTPGTTTVEATYGSALPSIAENLPTKTGYDFGGYYTEINGNGTQYYHGTGTGARNWDIASERTLYAYWKPNTCTLIFNMNGGVGEQPNLTATYDQPMPALTAPLPTLSGFEFSGYFDAKTGGVMYYNAAGESARNWDKTNGQKTLYAQWAAIHTITWMVNGSQAEGNPTTSVVNGQTITTLPTTPDVDCNGKVFVGWTTAEIVGETATIPDPLYTELGDFPVITSNMTFYAVFANGSGDERWVETDIANINSGDEVVISIMKHGNVDGLTYTYALPHNNGTTSAPAANALENIQNGVLSNAPNQDLVWTIEKDNENNLIFHPVNDGTLSLYCNKDDDGVRVGKTANALTNQKFIIYDNYLTNIATTRFVGVSFNTNTWRCYTNTTGVISDQTLKFYEKTTVYTSYTNYSTSCVAGEFDITNTDPIYVTSAVGQKIKATDTLVLTTTDMAVGTEISLSAPNITFYKEDIEITQLTTSAASETFELEIAYQPTVANTTEQPTITLEILGYKFTIDNKISCRSLPENFVIATKVGATWYALPANMNGATNPEGVVIDVDETTMTAIAPNTTVYTLFPVATVNGDSDRYKKYGERLRFAAVNNGNKGLWANNSKEGTDINNYAAITAANSTAGAAYEWKITTTIVDGNWQYTLQTDQSNNQKYLRYWTAASGGAKWGTYASGNEKLYFLPVTTYTDLDLEVMEWGTNSMVIRAGEDLPQNVNITINGTTTPKTLQNINGSDLYKIDDVTLTSDDCGTIIIDNGSNARKIIRKPLLVSGNKSGSEYTTSLGRDICAECDIVILNGGKLIADEAKSTGSHVDFANIYVYPGGKLVLDGKSLGVKRQVYLRGGYSWLNPTTYALPEVYLNGTIDFNGSGNIIYDYYIQNYKYYQFSLPYDVQLAKVTDESGADDFPVWVKHYNGALRAADANATSWEWYYGDNFEAGIGYIIAAKPRQEDKVANRPLSIIRFPLGNKAFNSTNGIETDLTITTTAHGIEGYKAGTVTANNVGWNFIGNPFMSTWKGDIGYKQLAKHPDENNWDGTYHWVDSDVKYITIMSAESGSDYAQYIASDTELKPFFPFYLQETADGGTGTINFAAANRIQKAPAMLSAETPREAFVQIEITAEGNTDQTGMFIGDCYSDDIDFNDYEKMFGSSIDKPKVWLMHEGKRMAFEAVTESTAAAYTAIGYRAPQTGKYMFAINEEASKLSDVEAVYLTDNLTGVTAFDLMSSIYEFESDNELYNDTRFTIHIVLRDESPGTTTGVGNLLHFNSEQPMKFIYQDKMYILQNGVIYDAMGKQVQTINK